MQDVTDRIAQLPPEKRALLIQKLTGRASGGAPPAPVAKPAGPRPEWDSFCCDLATPGNFAAIDFRPLEQPPPGPGQVQIQVKAFSLNFRDLMIAMNMYPPSPGVPSIMGSDYAGVVLACGDGVSEFAPGDRVMALSAGSLTPENQVVPGCHLCSVSNASCRQVVHQAGNLSFEEAAGIPTVYLTTYHALCQVARLAPGERVLIHTATGGVGLAAIQIANWIGAEIFATAGSEEKRAFLRDLGIRHVMDSRTLEFADEVLELTDGQGVDVVLNTLSGEAVEKGVSVLGSFGRFLQLDKQDIARNSPLGMAPFKRALTFSAIDLSLFFLYPDRLKKLMVEINEHLAAGDFSPVHHTAYPIAKLGEALTFLSRSKHIGKLVLTYE